MLPGGSRERTSDADLSVREGAPGGRAAHILCVAERDAADARCEPPASARWVE